MRRVAGCLSKPGQIHQKNRIHFSIFNEAGMLKMLSPQLASYRARPVRLEAIGKD